MSALQSRLEHLPADVLGLSKLARTALAEGSASGVPVARRIEDIARLEDRHPGPVRQELVHGIDQGLTDVFGIDGLPGRARTSLEVLGREGTLAVVTGQQPGLFAGPLYTLYKALQACRLAAELSRKWGIPVVPVFWNHGEDHDISEVNHTYLVNRNLDVQKVGLPSLPAGRQPISRILLDEETNKLDAARALFAHTYGDYAHVDWALDLCGPRHGESLTRALTRALTGLLGEHGLVVVEPDWIRPVLSRALADIVGKDPRAALRQQAQEASGGAPAIDPETAALVFRVDENGRQPLRLGGDGYKYDEEPGSRTPVELAAMIVDEPEKWSAGGLLRPLVQDAVFPSCAYVGGWGELAYHAQLAAARDVCGIPRTAFVPRISCTLVEPDVEASLGKLECPVGDILRAKGEYEPPRTESAEPDVFADLKRLASEARTSLMTQREALGALDPSLGVALKKAASQMEGAVDKLLGKAMRVHANHSGKGERHVRRANHSLVPRGKPQERVLGPVPSLAQFGPAFVDALWRELPPISAEHIAVHLSL